MRKQVFVVAVSGGVDSVVLLNKLVKHENPDVDYVVAHFDHGIRDNSDIDAKFVEELAEKYELDFEIGYGHLGDYASEETARDARYSFLRSIKEKNEAEKIVTAHHQDDLLETMILNITRGTSPRGLAPMNGQTDILRPLIHKTKIELIEYAKLNNLSWVEDDSNQDEKYQRNYVRRRIIPKIDAKRDDFLSIYDQVSSIYQDIDLRIQNYLPEKNILSRTAFVQLPYIVQKELVRSWLTQLGVRDLTKQLIERVTMAVKTLPAGSKIDIKSGLWLISERQNVLIVGK